MGHPITDILLFTLFALTDRSFGHARFASSKKSLLSIRQAQAYLPAIFLLATVRRGPLRVLALVFVF